MDLRKIGNDSEHNVLTLKFNYPEEITAKVADGSMVPFIEFETPDGIKGDIISDGDCDEYTLKQDVMRHRRIDCQVVFKDEVDCEIWKSNIFTFDLGRSINYQFDDCDATGVITTIWNNIRQLWQNVQDLWTKLATKQNRLIAGNRITLTDNGNDTTTIDVEDVELFVIVDSLPAIGTTNRIYLIYQGNGVFEKWGWVNNDWAAYGMLTGGGDGGAFEQLLENHITDEQRHVTLAPMGLFTLTSPPNAFTLGTTHFPLPAGETPFGFTTPTAMIVTVERTLQAGTSSPVTRMTVTGQHLPTLNVPTTTFTATRTAVNDATWLGWIIPTNAVTLPTGPNMTGNGTGVYRIGNLFIVTGRIVDSIGANGDLSRQISFGSTSFNHPPSLTLTASSHHANLHNTLGVGITNISTTGAHIDARSTLNQQQSIIINWVAIGTGRSLGDPVNPVLP